METAVVQPRVLRSFNETEAIIICGEKRVREPVELLIALIYHSSTRGSRSLEEAHGASVRPITTMWKMITDANFVALLSSLPGVPGGTDWLMKPVHVNLAAASS